MLDIKNIYKTYTSTNGVSCRALENVSLQFEDSGIVFILGKSGSGKSTLLNIIGGLDKYDRGQIIYNGQDFSSFSNEDYENYRNLDVGFVFQDFSLLDNLTVFENVKLALSLKSINDNQKVYDALEKVGILDIASRKISELTGGQKQRVAIARGIVKEAKIILADEPTGSLDSENSKAIMDLLISQSKESLVIIVTHNKELALSYGTRIIEIKDGFVLKDMAVSNNAKERKMMYSSTVLHLPKGKEIDKNDVNEINNIMSNKRQDYFFLIENDNKRLASMYPNLKEVFIVNENDNKYDPYILNKGNVKEVYQKEFTNGLSYKDSFKLGKSLVKKRKGKLTLSIIILTLAIVIMGAISNFATYSLYNAISYSLKQDNMNYLEIASSFSISDSQYKIQGKDVKALDDLGYEYAKNYDVNLSLATTGDFKLMRNHGSDELFGNRFTGFIETDDIDLYGYKLIVQKENIQEEDLKTGVNISSTVAYTMALYLDCTIDDLIGKKLKINNYATYIIGIFDSDYEYYSKIKEATGSELNKIRSDFYAIKNDVILKLVVSTSFMETYKDNYQYFSNSVTCIATTNKNMKVQFKELVDASKLNITTNINAYFFDSEYTKENFSTKSANLKSNEILIGRDVYKAIFGTSFSEDNIDRKPGQQEKSISELIDDYNNAKNTLLIKRYDNEEDKELFYAIDNVKIVGVFLSQAGLFKFNGIYLGHDYFVSIANEFFKPSGVKISLENKDIKKAVNDLYNNGFVIKNDFVSSFISISSTIEKLNVVVDLVLIIWLVLMATLFYSFMSKSINDNKRRIGILKALGSKGNDIYKIFMYEAILLGAISLILGIGSYCGISLLVNYLISLQKGYYFSLFIINFKTILLMSLPTIIVLFFALIIPIKKANSIRPIEVMTRE